MDTQNPWREKWQQRYAERCFFYGAQPNRYLQSQTFRVRAGQRALCPGEGEGRNAVWLAGQGLDVTAVDFSPIALSRAREHAARQGVAVTTIEADLSRWDWPVAAFDLVALVFLQLTPEERRPVHAGAMRALAPGGILVLEGFAKGERMGCGPSSDESRYEPLLLRADFAGLEFLELMQGMTVLAEGTGHHGPANVVRMVARRP